MEKPKPQELVVEFVKTKKPKPARLKVQFVRTPNPADEAIFLMLQLIDQKERNSETPEQILRWVKGCFRDFQTGVLPTTKARA